MKVTFTKYHGTGNDFIMIDCTNQNDFKLNSQAIKDMCHRRFGIGSDGLILIKNSKEFDFEMDYYNADGSQSFCGNGARCAVHFARQLNLFKKDATFKAIDGKHEATIHAGEISIKMADVSKIDHNEGVYIINTGSPHYIEFKEQIEDQDIFTFGKKIRYSAPYKKTGINVNLAQVIDQNTIQMLTYERGVEKETYSCGTGATAVALAFADKQKLEKIDIQLGVKGGNLRVKASRDNLGVFHSIYLIGPATPVYQGQIQL
ncbi:diaminopimelate epimerase [Brumimicrobium salinarum]|uniref:Diaminopimelate epimerase n=1 Tax=Brumimicrobium salinarum TaxID=2058658 RepID=A0A2I0R0M7_9FLAO|nr:diaminopimelate epimerase [Brumimicrobium salinarum]PKR80146.1 diaminopimelate epimerase [Brumimicrobium salinarum]